MKILVEIDIRLLSTRDVDPHAALFASAALLEHIRGGFFAYPKGGSGKAIGCQIKDARLAPIGLYSEDEIETPAQRFDREETERQKQQERDNVRDDSVLCGLTDTQIQHVNLGLELSFGYRISKLSDGFALFSGALGRDTFVTTFLKTWTVKRLWNYVEELNA